MYLLVLFVNLFLTLGFVWYLKKYARIVGFQLGMNISMGISGFFSLLIGCFLIYEFPIYFVEMTLIASVSGGVLGGLIGSLFDYQTLITGVTNGIMVGLMGPMLGTASFYNFYFLLFLQIVFILFVMIVSLSVKRT